MNGSILFDKFTTSPVICLSHLRWNFVFQRPQHIMSRLAKSRPVFYFEEPILDAPEGPSLEVRKCPETGVVIATPHLPQGLSSPHVDAQLQFLLDKLCRAYGISHPLLWYYTPMMRAFSAHLQPSVVVYDCMDELANFKFAPPTLLSEESRLLEAADLVFTGGFSLFEAKRDRHPNVHAFPSSIDRDHFAQARIAQSEPGDQAGLPRPRLGFFGVIDERMDLALLEAAAAARPGYQFVMVGPIVKIDQATLPRRDNIHYLGQKSYAELPGYLSGWDAALMPFALNEATRFISPTKTPEYLAGGRPVVSTAIADVVRDYGDLAAVHIGNDVGEFLAGCDAAVRQAADEGSWRAAVDERLADRSWDRTVEQMLGLIGQVEKEHLAESRSFAFNVARRDIGSHFDYLIVGAGFAGAVMAERLARVSRRRVLLIDRRPHIAGNAYDHHDQAGILIHRYGPHIFHTNSAGIARYLSAFTGWRPYEHRVLAETGGMRVPMPINRTTLNTLYRACLHSDEAAAAFLQQRAEPLTVIRTAEDAVVASVGRDLYERFFQGYTRKQWGLDPSQLDRAVTARVPARVNLDDRYFTDSFQNMPLNGYTRMFENMLDHPRIRVELNLDYRSLGTDVTYDRLVFTGPVDEFFDYRFGRLPYRSLAFRHCTVETEFFQETAVVNYPAADVPWTRVTEYKHMTGQRHPRTSITYEFPRAEGDPFYPVPKPENQALYKRYEALADAAPNTTFVGRLATYRYYNMDQVVGQALAAWRRLEPEAGTQPAEVSASGPMA